MAHGQYYRGTSDRGSFVIARWDARAQMFGYRASSCGFRYTEYIDHPERQEGNYATFTPTEVADHVPIEIPLAGAP